MSSEPWHRHVPMTPLPLIDKVPLTQTFLAKSSYSSNCHIWQELPCCLDEFRYWLGEEVRKILRRTSTLENLVKLSI